MKFEAKILGAGNAPLQGNLDPNTSSPAEYFAGCVYLAVDLMNGGTELQKISTSGPGFSPELAPQSAFVMFITTLHDHPAFTADKVLAITDPNYLVYQEIA